MKSIRIKRAVMGVIAVLFAGVGMVAPKIYAEEGFSMSPMKQDLVLDPGDSYKTAVSISNPGTSEDDFKYKVEVKPYYVNDDYQSVNEEVGQYNQIVDWITLNSPDTGSIAPNETVEISFTIDVPEWAPGGGQYAQIVVTSDNDNNNDEGMTVKEELAIGHIIYVEITGDTSKQGEFQEISVPGFIFSGDIRGSSAIRNTGNTHGEAKYTLQVYPLFSDEEIYTNEENPNTHMILPDRTYYDNDTFWPNTPMMGIYNVKYTVEYEGVTKEVSKLVVKCPIWMLFIIIAVIAALIIWIIMRVRARSKTGKRMATSNPDSNE